MANIEVKSKEFHLCDIIDNPEDDTTELLVASEGSKDSSHVPSSMYLCRICDTSFPSFSDLRHHSAALHFLEMKFHCRICLHSFRTESELDEHLLRAHSVDSYIDCIYCGKNFTVFSTEYEPHLRYHTEYQNQIVQRGFRNCQRMFYICEHCKKIFWHREDYTEHMTVHTLPTDGNDCIICGRKCITVVGLKSHMAQAHRATKNLKRVKLPNLPSSTREKMDRKDVTDCPYCTMKISYTMSFETHIRFFHRGIPPDVQSGHLRCTVCGKVFLDLPALISHVNYYETHGNTHGRPKTEMIFKCPTCATTFLSSKDLETHIAVKHGNLSNENTKCLCGSDEIGSECICQHYKGKVMYYQFYWNNLGAVMCPICHQTVKEMKWLYVHLDVFHKNFIFVCKLCRHYSENTESLKEHIKLHKSDGSFENIIEEEKTVVAEMLLRPHEIKTEVADAEREDVTLPESLKLGETFKVGQVKQEVDDDKVMTIKTEIDIEIKQEVEEIEDTNES